MGLFTRDAQKRYLISWKHCLIITAGLTDASTLLLQSFLELVIYEDSSVSGLQIASHITSRNHEISKESWTYSITVTFIMLTLRKEKSESTVTP